MWLPSVSEFVRLPGRPPLSLSGLLGGNFSLTLFKSRVSVNFGTIQVYVIALKNQTDEIEDLSFLND